MTNKVHIDAPAGIIDIEGEKDFIEGLLTKFFPLIEEAGFGSKPPNHLNTDNDEDVSSFTSDSRTSDEATKTKNKRRRGGVAPKGQSCSDRLLTLKADGFFKEHRSGADIIAGLKAKGWTHKSNQVAAAAGNLFDRGQLQRTKEGNGPFKYFWDRE